MESEKFDPTETPIETDPIEWVARDLQEFRNMYFRDRARDAEQRRYALYIGLALAYGYVFGRASRNPSKES